jgi:hypothetical protein
LPFTPLGRIVAKLLWRVPELALRTADTLEVVVGRGRDTFSHVREAAALVVVLAIVGTLAVTLRKGQNSAGSCRGRVSVSFLNSPEEKGGLLETLFEGQRETDSPMAKMARYLKREGMMDLGSWFFGEIVGELFVGKW